jgi:hypothetical protein
MHKWDWMSIENDIWTHAYVYEYYDDHICVTSNRTESKVHITTDKNITMSFFFFFFFFECK